MDRDRLIEDLKRDEGLRLVAYRDSVGILTIGFGHTGRDVVPGLKWSLPDAEAALKRDIQTVTERLQIYEWFRELDPVRQLGFANLAFNVGVGGVLGFHHALAAIAVKDYDTAADQLLRSKWAKQVGKRALRVSELVRTGKFPDATEEET